MTSSFLRHHNDDFRRYIATPVSNLARPSAARCGQRFALAQVPAANQQVPSSAPMAIRNSPSLVGPLTSEQTEEKAQQL